MVHPYLSGLMALVTLWLAVGTEANANHPRLFEHRQISHPYQNTSSSISPSHSSRHPTSSETLSHSNSTNTISITSRTSSSKSSISSSTSLKITSSPSSSSIPVTTPPSGTGVIVSQQTTTVNGKIQTHPVIVGGVFTSPVTLDSPDPTPLNPTGEPAKSSAKSISSSYSAVLGEITSWLENKDQAKATPILASLKGVLPEIGTMVNNLPNGKKSLSGGCKSAGKKRYLKSSPRVEGSIKETRKSSSSLKGAVTRFLRGQPIVQRDILGGLLGGLNKLLCSTTDLIDDFTKVTGTKDQGVINNLANGIKSTINGVDLGVVGGGGGGGDGGDGDGDNDDDNNTSTKSTDKTTTESSKKSSTSSSTASCTKSVTATFESIFCTVTASVSLPEIQRRQTACSSRVYKTVTGCSVSNSATRTTTIVAASKTPFSDTCSPETCGGTSCDSGKRDLEKRVYEDAPQRRIAPARGEWAEPANYGGDRSAFFRGEVARAYLGQGTDVGAVALNIKDTSQPTSSYTRRWTDEVATVAVAGLYGCTSVVVVSQRGVWATHMWENPSFTGAQLIAGFWYFDDYDLDVNGLPKYKYFEPIYEDENQKNQRFQREIIGAIHKGNGIDSWHSLGLDQLRNGQNSPVALLSHIFDTEAQPQVFIVTSRPRASTSDPNRHVDQNAGKRAYDRQIEEIREEIDDIFEEKAPIQVIDYYPITTPIDWPHNNDPSAVQSYQADSRGADVRGKILIQYKPAPDCAGKAKYRVWHQGQFLDDSEREWQPLQWADTRQVIPQQNQGNQKRASGDNQPSKIAACPLPSKSSVSTSSSVRSRSSSASTTSSRSSVSSSRSLSSSKLVISSSPITTTSSSLSTTRSSVTSSRSPTSSKPATSIPIKTTSSSSSRTTSSASQAPPYCSPYINPHQSITRCDCTDHKTFSLATQTTGGDLCPQSSPAKGWSQITPPPTTTTAKPPASKTTTQPNGDIVVCTSYSKIQGIGVDASACVGTTISTAVAYATGTCNAHIIEYGSINGVLADITLQDNDKKEIGSNRDELPKTWKPLKWGSKVTVKSSKLRHDVSFEFIEGLLDKRDLSGTQSSGAEVDRRQDSFPAFSIWDMIVRVGDKKWTTKDDKQNSLPRCEVQGWYYASDAVPVNMPFPIPNDGTFSSRELNCRWECKGE